MYMISLVSLWWRYPIAWPSSWTKSSGSFTFENRELFYTIKEEILVDRFEKKLRLEYEKNEDFNRGVHKVVLYTKNYIIGSSEFLVK